MDTKLKKSHKLTTFIIVLCVMIPAIFLVSLYPRMEKAMLEKREAYLKLEEEQKEHAPEWEVQEDFINYAMEACYYLHAEMKESFEAQAVHDGIFQQYGWDKHWLGISKTDTGI